MKSNRAFWRRNGPATVSTLDMTCPYVVDDPNNVVIVPEPAVLSNTLTGPSTITGQIELQDNMQLDPTWPAVKSKPRDYAEEFRTAMRRAGGVPKPVQQAADKHGKVYHIDKFRAKKQR